jgi:hypothetical protein
MNAPLRKQKARTTALRGPRILYPDGTAITPPRINVDKVLKQLEQQSDVVRTAFLSVFAHSLTVDIRALLLDEPVPHADLERVRHINEFLHQLTSCANPRHRRSASGDIELVRAIIDTTFLYGIETAAGRALAAATGNLRIRRERQTIDEASKAISNAAAAAVRDFAAISGVSPREHLPEAFVISFVFQRLAGLFPMTMETNLRKVWRWHLDRLGGKWSRQKEDAEVSLIVNELGQRRIDLVIYLGEPTTPSESQFLAMVEFKLWTRSLPDREKILDVLDHINSCPNGVICSIIDDPVEAERAEIEGWFVVPVESLPHKMVGEYFACTQHFPARGPSN